MKHQRSRIILYELLIYILDQRASLCPIKGCSACRSDEHVVSAQRKQIPRNIVLPTRWRQDPISAAEKWRGARGSNKFPGFSAKSIPTVNPPAQDH